MVLTQIMLINFELIFRLFERSWIAVMPFRFQKRIILDRHQHVASFRFFKRSQIAVSVSFWNLLWLCHRLLQHLRRRHRPRDRRRHLGRRLPASRFGPS